MRRRAAVLAALAALLLLVPVAAQAQDSGGQRNVDGSLDTSGEVLPEPHIIPRPNEGHAPEDAGDRGGALQLTLLVVMVAAVGGGVAYVVRESRKARAATSS